MTPEERERMNSLCIGIQEETDYSKYATLLCELSELLARKEQRRFKQHATLVWPSACRDILPLCGTRRILSPAHSLFKLPVSRL